VSWGQSSYIKLHFIYMHIKLVAIYIYLIRQFVVWYHWVFLRVGLYLNEPVGQVKIQTGKNSQRYYTTKRLIRDLLSKMPNCFFFLATSIQFVTYLWYLYLFKVLFVLYKVQLDNKYILLDVLVCSIAVYFYESWSILASPKGESKYKWWVKIYSDTTH